MLGKSCKCWLIRSYPAYFYAMFDYRRVFNNKSVECLALGKWNQWILKQQTKTLSTKNEIMRFESMKIDNLSWTWSAANMRITGTNQCRIYLLPTKCTIPGWWFQLNGMVRPFGVSQTMVQSGAWLIFTIPQVESCSIGKITNHLKESQDNSELFHLISMFLDLVGCEFSFQGWLMVELQIREYESQLRSNIGFCWSLGPQPMVVS